MNGLREGEDRYQAKDASERAGHDATADQEEVRTDGAGARVDTTAQDMHEGVLLADAHVAVGGRRGLSQSVGLGTCSSEELDQADGRQRHGCEVKADDDPGQASHSRTLSGTDSTTLLTAHAACGKSWKQRGNRTGHCSGCHHTFEGITLFDLHRRGGVCADPTTMTVGGLPLVFDGTHGDGAWSADPSLMKAAFQGRETGEGTSGTGDASEAANRHICDQTEAVLP